jgi:tyrosine-protein kinase Etk/Wzc
MPVITVIDAPVPPAMPSGPRRSLTLMISLMLGMMLGIAGAFVRNALQQEPDDPAERAKIAEIRAGLTFWRRKRRRQR